MARQGKIEGDIMVEAAVKRWEDDGFVFVGNGGEINEDDPELCPYCDDYHIFWALWEKGEKLNAANLCMNCGHRWIDED